MDPERFEGGASGRLVRAGRGEGTCWAFIPAPLPPAITFDGELVRSLSIPQVQKRLSVTYHAARRCVERLVEADILRQMGEWSYGKVFFAPDILGIVADDASAAAALDLYFP